MTPAVCKAARALAGVTQRELAEAANISTQTVADFERGARHPHPNNLRAMQQFFELRGIQFLWDGEKIVGLDFRVLLSLEKTR